MDWWCDCPSGARYVGCCSHVPSVIWFLSFQRWQTQSHHMRSSDFIHFFTDAAVSAGSIESSTGSDDDDTDSDGEEDSGDDSNED